MPPEIDPQTRRFLLQLAAVETEGQYWFEEDGDDDSVDNVTKNRALARKLIIKTPVSDFDVTGYAYHLSDAGRSAIGLKSTENPIGRLASWIRKHLLVE